jgi:hypothetical protein
MCAGVSHGIASASCPRLHLFLDLMIIIKFAASAFQSAYNWVFDPSLVSHSILPKNLSDGEHKEPLQRPGHQL